MKKKLISVSGISVLIALVSACSSDDPAPTSPQPDPYYDINGTIRGQTGNVLVDLSLNGQLASTLTVLPGDSVFTFSQIALVNDSYQISIYSAPANQDCSVTDYPSGTVNGTVSGINIVCSEWLFAHNQLRQQLNNGSLLNSPQPLTPVAYLEWDPILEQVAQTYIDTCTFAHNANRTTDYQALGGSASYVGENIAYSSVNFSAQQFFDLWAAEESNFVYEALTSGDAGLFGHYSQLIWRNTTRVGCATAICVDGIYAVCNYAPGGNYLGQYPY